MVKRRHVDIVPHNLRKAKRGDSKRELRKGKTGVREVGVWCQWMIRRYHAMAMESNGPENLVVCGDGLLGLSNSTSPCNAILIASP